MMQERYLDNSRMLSGWFRNNQLALDTLEAMDNYPAKSGTILYSDQGILYMTDDFQAADVEWELTQSMSRRGNCGIMQFRNLSLVISKMNAARERVLISLKAEDSRQP